MKSQLKNMNKTTYLKLLKESIQALNIIDVQIINFSGFCNIDHLAGLNLNHADYVLANLAQVTDSQEHKEEGQNNKLIFFAEMGIKWSLDKNGHKLSKGWISKDAIDVCKIETRYAATYSKTADLTKDHVLAFGSQNVVFNIWPYWREYVSSQTQKMGAPKLVLPFYQPLADQELKIDREAGKV